MPMIRIQAKLKRAPMKRDMELIRAVLLKLEEVPENSYLHNPAEDLGLPAHTFEEVAYHLKLLIDAGFLDASQDLSGGFAVKKITWSGHEFLDDTRDPDIWSKAKERAKGVANVGIGFLWEIAKAEIRTKLGLL